MNNFTLNRAAKEKGVTSAAIVYALRRGRLDGIRAENSSGRTCYVAVMSNAKFEQWTPDPVRVAAGGVRHPEKEKGGQK
jgi:hypothetical protein